MDRLQKSVSVFALIALFGVLLLASNSNASSTSSKASTSIATTSIIANTISTTTICPQNSPCFKLKNGTTTTIPNEGIYTGLGGIIYKIIIAFINFFRKY